MNRSRKKIRGPFWEATVDMLRLADPVRHSAWRTLFVSSQPRTLDDETLLPGTMLMLCGALDVRVQPEDGFTYRWKRSAGPFRGRSSPPTFSEIESMVRSGELSLLLIQADPDAWPMRPSDPFECLGGEINLDFLDPQDDAVDALLEALNLDEADPGAASRTGPARLNGTVAVHPGGLSVYGAAFLPWEQEPLPAPFQLARLMPDPDLPGTGEAGPGYRLTVERERLTRGESDTLRRAWGNLSRYLNPNHPLNALPAPAPAPRWVTLEIADPRGIPDLFWEIVPWTGGDDSPPLRFARGEITLLLSDQAPYDQRRPPTSLARVVLDDIAISEDDDGTIAIDIAAGAGSQADDPETVESLEYGAGVEPDGRWLESVAFTDLDLAFSPVETPRTLRESQSLPAPAWSPGAGAAAAPLETPVLWGFMPLEEGWAQLPVPNLTEQIYLDANVARRDGERPDGPATSVIQGAVAYGNDRRPVLTAHPDEQPWSVTLRESRYLYGQWRLEPGTGPDATAYTLATVELTALFPEVSVTGLLWLSTGAPTANDALPDVDDWVAGLRPVPLTTPRPGADLFPPAITLRLDELTFSLRVPDDGAPSEPPSALLGGWSFLYVIDEAVVDRFVTAGVLPAGALGDHLPLVWRRHPTLPMVQALPMTQSKSPPNHPSASRQLVPFELDIVADSALPPEERAALRHFGVSAANGAATWPRLLRSALPSREWIAAPDLPLAALSLPGLVVDPGTSPSETGMPAGEDLQPSQFRFDLPYSDETYALAQLPKVTRDPKQVSPLPDSPPPERARPLTRETFAAHWRTLSERASLAAASAREAFSTDDGATVMAHLVEPKTWPVSVTLDTAQYPGTLTVDNAAGDSAPLPLSDVGALEGISGRYVEDDAGGIRRLGDTVSADNPFVVSAGSMAAHREDDGLYRDQRGLLRGSSSRTDGLVTTTVRLDEDDDPCDLTSATASIPLGVAGDRTWRLWFRDLPVRAGTFDRQATRSPSAEDVNDPDALSREHDYLAGYEWRLAEGDPSAEAAESIWLFNLRFYPLTLESVTVAGEVVTRVEVIGRLQLPLPDEAEAQDLSNAVRVTFDAAGDGDATLRLAAVAAVADVAEWPLAMATGEADDSPRIGWTGIALTDDGTALEVSGVTLGFMLFDHPWSVALEPLTFAESGAGAIPPHVFEATDAALRPDVLDLALDLATGSHVVSLALAVRVGDASRPAFSASVRFPVLGPAATPPTWESGSVFGDLSVVVDPTSADAGAFQFGDNALQFHWTTRDTTQAVDRQFLPGMHLDGAETPGFVVMTFDIPAGEGGIPAFRIGTCFQETLLTCRWGEFLQAGDAAAATRTRVFGSSAGDLTVGYTAEWNAGAGRLEESFLLNGMLEVKDLVSFPTSMLLDAGAGTLTLPAARGGADTQPALDHVRHSARVLLNQHELPADSLAVGGDGPLFTFAADSWQFLAVVEHQLVDVAAGTLALSNDRRWTALQEFRLVTPGAFQAFLRSLDDLRALSPTADAPRIDTAAFGYIGRGMRERLAGPGAGTPELEKLSADALIVEASGVHWIKQQPLSGAILTTLQFLPGGSQHGILTGPEDYQPSSPDDAAFLQGTDTTAPQWTLLTIPFLGRLQHRADDLVEESTEAVGEDVSVLQIDPVLRLQRNRDADPGAPLPGVALAFATWSDEAPLDIAVSGLDGTPGRSWPRLEAVTLEENWFRLQNPLPEAEPRNGERARSVTATLPDTPARLSRAVALRRAFEAFRRDYPPRNPDDADLPPLSRTGSPVWRENSLAVTQAVTDLDTTNDPPYGWHPTAHQLLSGNLWTAATGAAPRRFVAATLLPTAPNGAAGDDVRPVSFAVSPYGGLEFRPSGAEMETRLISAELLAVNPATGVLRPVASNLSEIAEDVGVPATMTAIVPWARETHRRLSPDSPVAVLRLRQINENVAPAAAQAVLSTTYAFSVVPGIQRKERLTARSFRVRSPVAVLRFREGQYGGASLPEAIQPFEIAPPQVTGVQPLYLRERPAAEASRTWPWGLSAVRVATQSTADKEAVLGSLGTDPTATTMWWQAPRHFVQYRAASSGEGAAAGLPSLFRARAVRGFLPVLPDPPLPDVTADDDLSWSDPDRTRRWQPVLPGAMRYVVLGARPGVFLALRHQLIRQRDTIRPDAAVEARLDAAEQFLVRNDWAAWINDLNTLRAEAGFTPLDTRDIRSLSQVERSAVQAQERAFWRATAGVAVRDRFVSGSVPVQHRVPRPVPLPPNGEDAAAKATALQPWASYFEPTRNALWGDTPTDEAFFAACGVPPDVEPAHRFQIQLVTPRYGRVDPGWDGAFTARILFESPDVTIDDWELTVALLDGTGEFVYDPPRPPVPGIDAALQTAEAALLAGDIAGWLAALDDLGAQAGLPPLTDPGTADARAALHAEQVAFWSSQANVYRFALPQDSASTAALKTRGRAPGDVLRIQVSVKPCFPAPGTTVCSVAGFVQTLTLPLRVGSAVGPRLPLVPYFIHFEDPEYNRQLASPAALATGIVQRLEGDEVVVHTAAVAADRQEYNALSDIAVRYDWDADENLPSATVTFTRVDAGGNESSVGFTAPDGSAVGPLTSGALLQFALGTAARGGAPVVLEPGDTLRLRVSVAGADGSLLGEIFLDVSIVAEPVIPAPAAAYALLRAQEMNGAPEVECVRFAWSPEATRIEMVCSDDLRTEIVRRRAVFNWTDSVRPGTLREYAVQKIAAGGSTHMPPLRFT